jgi:hypothetical protein
MRLTVGGIEFWMEDGGLTMVDRIWAQPIEL